MTSDKYYLHLLNCFGPFGPVRLSKLSNHFPSYAAAFTASSVDLYDAGIEPNLIADWLEFKRTLDLEQEKAKLSALDIGILTAEDKDHYPRLLNELHDPPPILYYRGKLTESDELCVAVVGTRKISPYGQTVTPEIVSTLAENHLTVVSGLAYGVDALAHQTVVNLGGRTIAVLAGGLDDKTLYPPHHVTLVHEILAKDGLLLSEHPPGSPALKQNFVVRNRIIAGMCAGVLVVECDLKSGALITAKDAFANNRAVYAVPGPIFAPNSQGTNNLLKEKAKVVTEGADILNDLNLQVSLQAAPKDFVLLTPQEQEVLGLISREPILADDIIASLDFEPHITTAALTFLEIKGHIKNLGAQQYVRIK